MRQRRGRHSAPAASQVRPRDLPADGALQLVFPYRSEIFAAQNPPRFTLPLLHGVAAELRLPQMPQLRGNARRRVVRQFLKVRPASATFRIAARSASRRTAHRAASAARFAVVPFSEFAASFPPFPPISFLG